MLIKYKSITNYNILLEPPVFAIFITDGEPNVKKTEAMNEFSSASHEAIFFKFIALKGKQTDIGFSYLQSIDDHDVKKYENDNSDAFYVDNSDLVVLNNPDELTMEKLIHEYRGWLIEAKEKNILLHDPKVGHINTQEGRIVSNHNQDNVPLSPYEAWDNKLMPDSYERRRGCNIL